MASVQASIEIMVVKAQAMFTIKGYLLSIYPFCCYYGNKSHAKILISSLYTVLPSLSINEHLYILHNFHRIYRKKISFMLVLVAFPISLIKYPDKSYQGRFMWLPVVGYNPVTQRSTNCRKLMKLVTLHDH